MLTRLERVVLFLSMTIIALATIVATGFTVIQAFGINALVRVTTEDRAEVSKIRSAIISDIVERKINDASVAEVQMRLLSKICFNVANDPSDKTECSAILGSFKRSNPK